jgi:hypothetical protein
MHLEASKIVCPVISPAELLACEKENLAGGKIY